jgi:hypothetical protein
VDLPVQQQTRLQRIRMIAPEVGSHRRQAELALRVLGTDPQTDQATQDALQCRGIHAERVRQCRCGVVAMLELVGDAELRGDV